MGGSEGEHGRSNARLGLGDAISLMIGIVIGASVYETPPQIFGSVSGAWAGLGVWALGGLLSLAGALCYAELASTYPRLGGDYVYLSRAFGPWMGFLFGWSQLAVVRTANVGMMAFVFARYAQRLWAFADNQVWLCAAAAVIAVTLLNVGGVVLEKWTQNVLTLAKVLGLSGIVVAGFCWGRAGAVAEAQSPSEANFGLAMILVLYAYGGWSDAAFVAAELRRPRDIPRSLILGIGAITVIYLAVNAAYLLGLGFDGVRSSRAVAADLLAGPRGDLGERAMCLLVMVSALGSIHGTVFAGSRLYVTMGEDHRLFSWLGNWDAGSHSPVVALLAQALTSLAMIAAVAAAAGHGAYNGFSTLLTGTAPVFWGFFLLTGTALFVLRHKDRDRVRPFALRGPSYPLVPLVFCGTCLFMMYAAIADAKWRALIGLVPLGLGLPLYFVPFAPRATGERRGVSPTCHGTNSGLYSPTSG